MIDYVKAHACGNDFLIIDESLAHGRHADLARAMCSRHTGIGADGVEFLDDRRIRLFNSDGSEAEISGNGTRCVAAWLAHLNGARELVLETHAGSRTCRVVSATGSHFEIESEMGTPTVAPGTFQHQEQDISGAIVSTGNPHFVLFVDTDDFSYSRLTWVELGRAICESPQFPNGTNVEFVRVLSRDAIAIRIYERGAGPTTSSGTGSCAAAAAGMTIRGLSRRLRVEAPGGTQYVTWERPDAQMLLTGPADLIAKGEAFL
jgi:diaminopimelate epimerase